MPPISYRCRRRTTQYNVIAYDIVYRSVYYTDEDGANRYYIEIRYKRP